MIGRREFLARGLGTVGSVSAAAQTSENRLNLLFVAVDDLRPELGCYGNRLIQTPNLDRLARRSVVFERAYCQAPVCGPSRASLLTGLRPDTIRVWGNRTHFRETLPDVVTLPQRFKQSGYFTEAIGKVLHGNKADPPSWSVPAWPPGGRQAGMQYVDEERFARMASAEPARIWRGSEIPTLEWKKQRSWQAPDVPDNTLQDGQVADRAVHALRQSRDRPFFLAVGFQKPHLPFTAPKRYFDLYDPESLPLPANPRRPVDAPEMAFTQWQELRGYTDIPNEGPLPPGKARELVHGYYAAASYMDAQAGRVLDELETLGLAERTVVVLFGDHGWHLGEQALWPRPRTSSWPPAHRCCCTYRGCAPVVAVARASWNSWTCTRRFAKPAESRLQPRSSRILKHAEETAAFNQIPETVPRRQGLAADGLVACGQINTAIQSGSIVIGK